MSIQRELLIEISSLKTYSMINFSISKLLISDLLLHLKEEMEVAIWRQNSELRAIWHLKFTWENHTTEQVWICSLAELFYLSWLHVTLLSLELNLQIHFTDWFAETEQTFSGNLMREISQLDFFLLSWRICWPECFNQIHLKDYQWKSLKLILGFQVPLKLLRTFKLSLLPVKQWLISQTSNKDSRKRPKR